MENLRGSPLPGSQNGVTGATLIPEFAAAFAPPPLLTVSEWADLYRFLPEASAARGGRWRTRDTPYLRGIMDSVHEPGVRKIALIKGSQVGGSEALHNILGYFIAYDPCPMLFVHPTQGVAEEWSKERLDDMLTTTSALEAVVDRRDSTLDYKTFAGGYLALGGANTPNTFARRAVRVAIGDDVDRFPAIIEDEGDPAELLEERTRTFLDGLTIFCSTPTLKHGRIDTLYRRSDQRRFVLACPSCGRTDWVSWQAPDHFHVVYEGHDPSTSRLACPGAEHGGCGARMDEADRRRMVAGGRWASTVAAQESGLVGFHLPATLSTLGDVTLERLVAKWLGARQKGKESLRVFVNTSLAEGWEDRGARMNPHRLAARREDYGPDVEIPAPAVAVTAGVDVQDNRFELHVWAWGLGEESWLVDVHVVPGDPRKPETRAALLEALQRKYAHALGPLLPIHATCIDSGYATDDVYDFVLAHQARRLFATKGIAGRSGEPIVGKPSEKTYGKRPRPVRLYPINVDDAKAGLYSDLDLAEPGPKYLHFPLGRDQIDDEYFAQLCAEHKETRYNKAGVATHVIWVQDRERNEALDGAVLARAAYRLLNPPIRQMLETLQAQAAELRPATPEPTPGIPPLARPAVPPRRVSHSSYLRR